jgi:hypothetical protein
MKIQNGAEILDKRQNVFIVKNFNYIYRQYAASIWFSLISCVWGKMILFSEF